MRGIGVVVPSTALKAGRRGRREWLIKLKDGDNSIIATYYYDPFGRRLWKEVDGTRTYFLYSDEGLIGEYDSTGNEIETYGWTPDSIWGTDPLFQKIGSTYYFYQNDHPGTPQKLIGTNGLVVWFAVYDSFGNCQIEVERITNNLRFPGQYHDEETGLHYNWYRYYDPATGRSLSPEPFGVGMNLYAYCFNNPHNWIDPMGLCAVSSVGRRIKTAWDWWSDFWTSDLDFLIPEMWTRNMDYWSRYISIYTTNIVMFQGTQRSRRGKYYHPVIAPTTIFSGALDIYIGSQPNQYKEITNEIGLTGLGRGGLLSLGIYNIVDESGHPTDRGGIAIHIGFGAGLPFGYESSTLPDPNRPFSDLSRLKLYFTAPR